MSPEAQRIAIAGLLGWRRISGVLDEYSNFAWWSPEGEAARQSDIPGYLADLNAMHEAEKALTKEQQADYGERLLELVPYTGSSVHRDVFGMAHATAAQRAEAFLRATGKWEESS